MAAESSSLTLELVRGARWTYLGTLVMFLMQAVYAAVISRLLLPSAFGLFALASVVLAFSFQLLQVGLSSVIVQKKVLSDRDIRTAFTVSSIAGCILFALVWVLAPVVASLVNTSEVTSILRVMALSFVPVGVGLTANALLRRELRFKNLILFETLAYGVSYLGVGILAAARGLGVWSLVIASVTQASLLAAFALLKRRHAMRPLFDKSSMRDLSGFAGGVSAIGVLEFIGLNTDTVAVGRFLGPRLLGQYTRASFLIGLPLHHLATNISKVLLPTLSRIQEDLQRLKRAYVSGIAVSTGILIPCWLIGSVLAEDLVLFILGPQWDVAARLVPLVGGAQAIEMITHFPAVICEAVGELKRKFIIQLGHVLFIFAAIAVVVDRGWGVQAFAAAWLLGYVVRHFAYLVLMQRVLGGSAGTIGRSHLEGLFIGLVASGAALLAGRAADPLDLPTGVQLLWEGSVATLGLGLLLWLGRPLLVHREIVSRGLLSATFRR